MRARQVLALILAIIILSPIWLYLADSAQLGGEEYLVVKHGFNGWALVVREVYPSIRAYIKRYGHPPSSIAEARESGIFDLHKKWPAASYSVPKAYTPMGWRQGTPSGRVYRPPDILFRYDTPAWEDRPGHIIYIRRDGSIEVVAWGPWRPVWWHNVCLPYGLIGWFILRPKLS